MAKKTSDGKARPRRRSSSRTEHERLRVAGWIFTISFVPLLLIILASIAAPYLDAWLSSITGLQVADGGAKMVKDLQAAVLPLVSGWIGAVIAYYFVTNAQTQTTESVEKLISSRAFVQKLQATTLGKVMIPASDVNGVEIEGDGSTSIARLDEIFAPAPNKGVARTRALIFERVGMGRRVRAVIHMSTYFEFIARKLASGAARDGLTVEGLLGDGETQRRIANGTAYMAETETLEHAQQLMKRMPVVQDIVVTRNGRPEEVIVGYMTNGDILRHCVARAETPEEEDEAAGD